jgi:hypothetical protein
MSNEIVVTEEIRQAVLREECMRTGHAFDVVVHKGCEPTDLLCGRCGKRWPVVASDHA